jgi:hypothetical protein
MFVQEKANDETVKRPQEKMLTGDSFESHTDTPKTEEYVPDDRPRARDPLLAPRQGVKAPVE